MEDKGTRAERAEFVTEMLKGLIRLANEDRADMLAYLLETALTEAQEVERKARAAE